MTSLNSFQFEAWALLVALLFFKMLFNSLVQGWARARSGVLAEAEDAGVFGKPSSPEANAADLLQRATNCWRNDLENIPLFLFLSLGYILVGASTPFMIIALLAFGLGRVAHTICYLAKLQPYRTLAFNFANLASVAVALAIIWRVVRIWTLA
ncbi:MAG: MAPEG family protein [Bdellovibrionota bacterium]